MGFHDDFGLILIKPSSTHTPKNVCSANLGIWNRPMPAHQVMAPGDIPQSSSNDQRICSDVLAAIQQAAWRPDRLDVNVRDGVVHLAGFVTNELSRKAAIVAAENVSGVREVRDELCSYPPPEEDYGGGDF